MTFRAALIGCGRVGSTFSPPIDAPQPAVSASHAEAYVRSARAELIAVCDADANAARMCAARWGVAVNGVDPKAVLDTARAEIISICAPDKLHAALAHLAIGQPATRVVIIEKPLAQTLDDAQAVIDAARERGITLIVNYTRRFAPGFARLRSALASGDYGAPRSISGRYTKGVLHNGSHWFDLARMLLGDVVTVSGFDDGAEPYENEPSLGVRLCFTGGARGWLLPADESAFSVFDAEMLTADARIRIEDFGARVIVSRAMDDPKLPGYRTLVETERYDTGLDQALDRLIKHACDCADGHATSICGGEDGLRALQVGLAALTLTEQRLG